MSSMLLADLVAALDVFVMERLRDQSFIGVTPPPAWCAPLLRERAASGPFTILELFPFLEDFLPDANALWAQVRERRVASEAFAVSGQSEELLLRAIAINVGPFSLLALERLSGGADTRPVLQKARDNELQHERLQRQLDAAEVSLKALTRSVQELLGTDLTAQQRKLAEGIAEAAARAQAAMAAAPPSRQGL